MPTSQGIDIGPWQKGLVETQSPWDIPENALQECLNFDVADDGLLKCRRGFKRVTDANNWLVNNGAIANNQPIMTGLWGDYELQGGSRRIFASAAGAVNGGKWLYTDDPSAGWTELTDTISGGEVYQSSVIYNNQVYVVATTYSGIGFSGGKKFTKNNLGSNPLTAAAANLPKGEEAYMIKDRMFVVSYDESKIYWSKATDPETWTAPDGGFVLVNPNDGTAGIMSCVLVRDILYIFKERGIYQFSFTSDPALDGYLQKIAPFGGHGATDGENIYVANSSGCYQLLNGQPQLISQEVDWKRNLSTSIFMRTKDYRIMALRGQIIVVFGSGEEAFSMNTRTGAWSRYYFGAVSSPGTQKMRAGRFTRWCRTTTNGAVHYVTAQFFGNIMYYFREDWKSPNDFFEDSVVLVPRYRFKTKYLTVGERVNWKRLKRTLLDVYINTPSSAGGANLVMGIDTNTGLSNETRAQAVEPTPAALTNRWFRLGNRRFLSLAFTLDNSVAASYTPSTGNKDTLVTLFDFWFFRKFVTYITETRMQAS